MFGQWFRDSSPECGHLISRIIFALGSTSAVGKNPPVSTSTSYPSAHKRSIKVNASFWANGSPPVISTRLQPKSRTWSNTLSSETFSPPLKVYSLSHHTQRMGHPVRRTKVHGRPAWVDSPWIDLKISVTLNISLSRK